MILTHPDGSQLILTVSDRSRLILCPDCVLSSVVFTSNSQSKLGRAEVLPSVMGDGLVAVEMGGGTWTRGGAAGGNDSPSVGTLETLGVASEPVNKIMFGESAVSPFWEREYLRRRCRHRELRQTGEKVQTGLLVWNPSNTRNH